MHCTIALYPSVLSPITPNEPVRPSCPMLQLTWDLEPVNEPCKKPPLEEDIQSCMKPSSTWKPEFEFECRVLGFR